MNTSLALVGRIDDLFSHMALWGLAAICEDEGLAGVRGHWTDSAEPRPVLHCTGASALGIAEAVRRHAAARAARGSWMWAESPVDPSKPGSTVSTLAPRTAAPVSPEAWHALDADQERAMGSLPSLIDERLVQGLGYRSWWMTESNGKIRQDHGTAAWEMRTRNKGMDVVRDRLRLLAVAVAAWPPEKVLSGLIGEASDDEIGHNKEDSRSATGFRRPGPVDNVRAWCALWALSALGVTPNRRDGGTSPAFITRRAVLGEGRHQLLIAVPSAPLPLARFRTLQRSAQLVRSASTAELASGERGRALAWLRNRGADAILRFPVEVSGSASAPERQAMHGIRVVP